MHRPGIRDDMVLHHDQHMLVFVQLQQLDPQQRPGLQVEWPGDFVFYHRLQPGRLRRAKHLIVDDRRGLLDHTLDSLVRVGKKHRTQRFMALHQSIEGPLQGVAIKRTHQAQRGRNVISRAVRLKLPEEPLALLSIGKPQGLFAVSQGDVRNIGALFTQRLYKRSQHRLFKQALERYVDRQCLAYPRHDTCRQQGVTAQLEEMIFKTNLRQPQHLGPDRSHLPGLLADRCHVAFLQQAGVRLRQRLAVQLAVGRQRQARQEQHVRRHHIVRQHRAQRGLERLAQGALVGFRCHGVRHQIRQELVILGHHHRFTDSALLTQARLNFPQLDTEPAHLDLMVDAADVLDHAIHAITRQVAGAVQPLTVACKGVGHEALGGQPRPAVITPGQADTADQQFATGADRGRGKFSIKDKQRSVGNGSTHKRQRLNQWVSRRPDGGFRRAVQVPHRALLGQHALGQVGRQRFAAAQALDPVQHGTALAVEQHAPGRGGGLHDRDRLFMQQAQDGFGVLGNMFVRHHDRAAHRQGNIEFKGENIEGEGGQRQQPRLGVDTEGIGHAPGKAAQGAMAHHHTLGLAGGTGGVDHIRQVLIGQRDLRVVTAVTGVLLFTDEQHLLIGCQRQALVQVAGGQQHTCAAVFEHERQPVGRKLGVERHIGAARLEGRQQRQHHVHRTLQRHGHQHIHPDTGRPQAMGQAVGAQVQFCVAQ
ncbi:hypothetical protein ALQ17_01097 [Pseudomonas fluorescens]|nr:hypothetical protein ALQ17_01097 [Pseudomonas fluorescens]